jgi:hypothetical protein
MKEDYATLIDPVVKARWADTAGEGASVPVVKEPRAPFRAQVACEMFAMLSEAEKAAYGARAKAEAAEARVAYEKALKEQPSRTPEERHL